jgi:hypothetical protein
VLVANPMQALTLSPTVTWLMVLVLVLVCVLMLVLVLSTLWMLQACHLRSDLALIGIPSDLTMLELMTLCQML